MKFFADINIKRVDTDLNEINKLNEIGIFYGFTITIPSLTGANKNDVITYICKATAVPMIVECSGSDYTAIKSRGQELAKINKNIILTVPFTQDGLRACKALREEKIEDSEGKTEDNEGETKDSEKKTKDNEEKTKDSEEETKDSEEKIQTNISCCSIAQALLAANAGATYISVPADYNISVDGISLIEEICDIYKKFEFKTQILLTSIKTPEQVEQAIRIGVHAVAIPSSPIWELYQHGLIGKNNN